MGLACAPALIWPVASPARRLPCQPPPAALNRAPAVGCRPRVPLRPPCRLPPATSLPQGGHALLKDQLELVKVRQPDGPSRYTIKPLESEFSFDKGFFMFVRAIQLLTQHNKDTILVRGAGRGGMVGVVVCAAGGWASKTSSCWLPLQGIPPRSHLPHPALPASPRPLPPQVGLAGPSGSGKTAFSAKIKSFIPGCALLSMDNYNDGSKVIDGNFDGAFSGEQRLLGLSGALRKRWQALQGACSGGSDVAGTLRASQHAAVHAQPHTAALHACPLDPAAARAEPASNRCLPPLTFPLVRSTHHRLRHSAGQHQGLEGGAARTGGEGTAGSLGHPVAATHPYQQAVGMRWERAARGWRPSVLPAFSTFAPNPSPPQLPASPFLSSPPQVPIYDFKESRRVGYRTVEVPESRVVILEGIYALNARLRPQVRPGVRQLPGRHLLRGSLQPALVGALLPPTPAGLPQGAC